MIWRGTFLFGPAFLAIALCVAGCTPSTPAPDPSPRLSDPPAQPAPEPAPMVSLLTVEVPATPEPETEPVETPETPAAEEPAGAIPQEDAIEPGLSAENIAQVSIGMPYQEVVKYFGFQGLTVSSNGVDKFIVQWEDGLGISFWGKFEDDRLVRKTASNLDAVAQEEDNTLTHELYNSVTEGMSFEDVLARIGMNATELSDNEDMVIYRWQDENGSSFTARFENNRLTRRSGLTIIPLAGEDAEEAETADADADEEVVEDAPEDTEMAAEDGYVEGEGETVVPAEPRRRMRVQDRRGEDLGQLAENIVESVAGDAVTSIAAPSRVRVIGASRREREDAAGPRREYLQKAELPDYTYTLRTGRYEVRIHNDSEARVAVGMRKGKRGRDVTIEPFGRKSLFLDRGGYTLHYIFNDDPYTSYRSELINVGGTFVSDIEIAIFNEQYDIRKLIHGRPGS